MVSDFFGRKVWVSGALFITCFSVIVTTILAVIAFFGVGFNNIPASIELLRWIANRQFNTIYAFEFNSLGTNRNVNYGCALNKKVYFSTSSLNSGDSDNLKPAVIYQNADINKNEIFKENKEKSGVYRWINLNTGFSYVGSSVNLAKRFTSYYNYSFLAKNNMIISKAILKYGYSNFRLEILEYCAPEECIKREQFYIDTLKPEYNILKLAGSSLGHKHTEETLAKFKERKFSLDHLEKLRAHLTNLNKNQSEEQKFRARERILKLNEAKGIKVEVTDLRTNEITVYNSLRKTAEALSTDLKALRYNENVQKERGITVPFKKQYIVKIKRY
jgi:group I intron endonuclease